MTCWPGWRKSPPRHPGAVTRRRPSSPSANSSTTSSPNTTPIFAGNCRAWPGSSTRWARVHGEEDERLASLPGIYDAMQAELADHMLKEEQILFPAIRTLEESEGPGEAGFASIGQPIQVMMAEHDSTGRALETLRRLTDGFTPPDWACNTYRAMLDGLRELEADLHQHIHEENNILFPRALEKERAG